MSVADHPAVAVGATVRGMRPTLAVGCLGVALVVGSMVAFNTALGDVAVATSATQTQLNWIVDGYTIVLACLLMPAGAIGDRYGRRAAMLGGLAVFALASASPAFFDAPEQIIAARMVAGAGAAFVMPATLALLSSAYAGADRSKAFGVWAGVAGCAGVLGLLASGVLLTFADWTSICWALGIVGVIVFVATLTVPGSIGDDAPPVDWFGAVLTAASIATVVFALIEAPDRGWADPVTVGCLTAGALAAAAFGVYQRRVPNPLLDMRLFRDSTVAASAVTITVLFAATFGFFYLGMQYAQMILGYSALTAAAAFVPFGVPVVALSLLSSRYAPRLGMHRVLVAGTILIAIGFVCMLVLQRDSGYLELAVPTVIIGAGIGIGTAPATSAIMSSLRDERQGAASAVNDTTRELGAALGMAVTGSVLAHRYTGDVTASLTTLPPALREQAADSFGAAVRIGEAMGAQGTPIVEAAETAFVAAVHSSTVVLAVMAAIAALVVAAIAPR